MGKSFSGRSLVRRDWVPPLSALWTSIFRPQTAKLCWCCGRSLVSRDWVSPPPKAHPLYRPFETQSSVPQASDSKTLSTCSFCTTRTLVCGKCRLWIFDELRLACSRHCCDTMYVKQLTCFTVCSENCCTCGIVPYQDVNRVFLCRIVHCDLFPIYTHTLHMRSTQLPSDRDAFFTENFILHHEIFTFYWDSMKFSTFPSIKIRETGVSLGWRSL